MPLDCTGAALSAIVAKAGLNVGKGNNAKLAHSVLITADDGCAAAPSLGEIDPDYGNENVIIAYHMQWQGDGWRRAWRCRATNMAAAR